MFAGTEGGGAEEGWYTTAIQPENYQLHNLGFAGSAADIFKCSDQILRPLLYPLAAVAGMPTNILPAYARYQDSLSVYNSLALGLGTAHT